MTYNYIEAFPIPENLLPPRLQRLLQPIGLSPTESVEVASMLEIGDGTVEEHLHLLMAVVPGAEGDPIEVLDEAGDGVVKYSVPAGNEYACAAEYSPSISGYDYIVAAWGDSGFYTFNLAEKVWMTLGLTPRCVGNDHQRLVYDDLGLPEFAVAEGEVSCAYHYSASRNVTWKMSNEYLRRYLWLRGARGVRVFYYSGRIADSPEMRQLMGGEKGVALSPEEGVKWYSLEILENENGLEMQLWASVEAVSPELCPEKNADGILWPGDDQPMTHARADALRGYTPVYLDDRFLEKYEQNAFYSSMPARVHGEWYCSPQYLGQWGFTDCRRVGRNLVVTPMRELYKPKPDREILHARSYAVHPNDIAHVDLEEEHIVAKVNRLLEALLDLGENLSQLGTIFGLDKSGATITGFDRVEVLANGWMAYPILSRLAQVAPLTMSQQIFLARCKGLHEVWQRIPNGYLKSLLVIAGCPKQAINELASLKLMQALMTIVEKLNVQEEEVGAFASANEPEGWREQNSRMGALFLNNELRIADAHEAVENCLDILRKMGFDTATLNQGYGRALDFVMDGVIQSLDHMANELEKLLYR
jgi:hypothetical protein